MTANSIPIIKRARERVFLNIGHGMLGWTFAAGAAERVAKLFQAVASNPMNDRSCIE